MTYAIIFRRRPYAEVTASLHELVVVEHNGPDRMGTLAAVSFGVVAELEATAKGLGWTVVSVEPEWLTVTDLGIAELRWCKMVRERAAQSAAAPRLDEATAALVVEANKAWAELKREVEAAGPITADGRFSGLNVGNWLSSDPTHERIYAALERMIASRSKVCLSLRLDYARVSKKG